MEDARCIIVTCNKQNLVVTSSLRSHPV